MGHLGLEAAGAVVQGELNQLRRDIQVQREAELSLSLVSQQDTSVGVSPPAPTPAETERKELAPIQERPDREEVPIFQLHTLYSRSYEHR